MWVRATLIKHHHRCKSFLSHLMLVLSKHSTVHRLSSAHICETTDCSNIIIIICFWLEGRRLGSDSVWFLGHTHICTQDTKVNIQYKVIFNYFLELTVLFLWVNPVTMPWETGQNTQVASLWWKATNALRPGVHQWGLSLHLTTPKGTLHTQICERCKTNYWCVKLGWDLVGIWWLKILL